MEIAPSADRQAEGWIGKIQDWNLNACLPAGLNLADGRSVSGWNAGGFYNHGTEFGRVFPLPIGVSIQDIRSKFPDSNFLAVFPRDDGREIVWYEFKNYKERTEEDLRAGFYVASLYLLFNAGDGKAFAGAVKSEPTLVDAVISKKFPDLVTKIEIRPWKKLLLIPADLVHKDIDTRIEELSSRE